MTEWNEQLVPGGSGFVAYRLMVEGWPHQWVTDPRIVHVVSETSRKTYPGLQYEGLRISERMVLREAWPEVDGITAKIVPSDANEDTIDGFTKDARVVASLQGSLTASSSAWNTRRSLASPGIYHLGTEAVYVTGAPTIDGPEITRGFWGSEPQDHDVIEFGAGLWNLRFLGPGASVPTTERQAAYCWIADDDGVYMQDAFIENFPSSREFV